MRDCSIIFSIMLICLILLPSCSNESNMQSENNNVVPLSNPPINGKEEQPTAIENKSKSLPTSPNPFAISTEEAKKGKHTLVKEIYNEVFEFSKTSGLSDLDKEKFLPQDNEIRVWIVDASNSIRGFVSSYKQGKNQSFEIISGNKKNSSIKRNLDAPKSGWDKWWKYLETQEVLSKQSTNHISNVDPDTEIVVIEVKTNTGYISNLFSSSEINKNNESLTSLCTKVSEEFSINFCY